MKATNKALSNKHKELKHYTSQNISKSFFNLNDPAPKVGLNPLLIPSHCILLHISNHIGSKLMGAASCCQRHVATVQITLNQPSSSPTCILLRISLTVFVVSNPYPKHTQSNSKNQNPHHPLRQ